MQIWSPKVMNRVLRDSVAQFRTNDAGNMSTLAVCLFFCMVMIGGLAVDLMRYETVRTGLQQTLDRSVLAAAALNQDLDPETVVNDYFNKAGLSESLTSLNVELSLNSRTVTAEAFAATNPIFLHMIGQNELDAGGRSTANQRVSNIDIALVLDVSDSMNANNRLPNLKTAALEFVDTVLSSDGDNKIAIQIVPFAGQVNLGPVLSSYYNLTEDHEIPGVDCVELPSTAFTKTGISTSEPLSVSANADPASDADLGAYKLSDSEPNPGRRACPPVTGNAVRLPTNSIPALQQHINGLTTTYWTSINAGMKWGLTLMDPGSRNMFTALRNAGELPDLMKGRPFNYDDEDSLKIIVLMTDGMNSAQLRMKKPYKVGPSTIWRMDSASANQFSAFHQSRVNTTNASTICASRPFWVPHLSVWHSRPWNGVAPDPTACYEVDATYVGATRQTWPQVWAGDPAQARIWKGLRVSWLSWHLYSRAFGNSGNATWYNAMVEEITPTTMNRQLQSVCDLAKDKDVVVYGIAFEAPSGGQTQIRACSTSTAHYFNAKGLQIRTAFRTIANNISQLRLTQ